MGKRRATGWFRLFACVSGLGLVWIVLLPRVGALPGVRSSVQFLKDRKIDPSAMFYTDLEAMPAMQSDLERIRREQSRAFWLPAERDSRIAGS